MAGTVCELAERAGFLITDEVVLPGHEAQTVPVPAHLDARLLQRLCAAYPTGIYSHQALALAHLEQDQDVCLATPTASGKSLVFLTYAAALLLRDATSRVIALYPAKALIQDQREKWTSTLKPLGLSLGVIDGGVPADERPAILRRSRAVLMTPDVVHAWLMSNLELPPIQRLLSGLRLLVLDEAHVYDGVFGTNMAYLLRRLSAVAAPYRLICSTATLDDPAQLIRALTGRETTVIGGAQNGAQVTERRVVSIRPVAGDRMNGIVSLIRTLGAEYSGRFLVFADSRRMVEVVVASLSRGQESPESGAPVGVLPYRAGYEEEDRVRIQAALREGSLKGVVSTSALELGLDIGEIDLVVLLGVPPTMKAFWQRLGRAGRRRAGTCLMLDDADEVSAVSRSLDAFLSRPIEPSRLYLDNRYIQYAHALCMAVERRAQAAPLPALPDSFRALLENELNPTAMVPNDLYPLKQRAQGDPHHQFPLRSGVEPNLQVEGPFIRLGSLTWQQTIREAYPGAVYYYMARPYRITSVLVRQQKIQARSEKQYFTQPISQVMIFPSFAEPMAVWRSDRGFVAESPMQVSERVLGFRELQGTKTTDHRYGPFSTWSKRELTRFFETTGVCWTFDDPELSGEPVANALLDAFSLRFGLQRSDLGVGAFFAKQTPFGPETCRGACVYDTTHGSLRLTQLLGERLPEILETAIAQAEPDPPLAETLKRLAAAVSALRTAAPGEPPGATPAGQADEVLVVAPGERAMLVSAEQPGEVIVRTWRYTPQGLLYELQPDGSGVTQRVPAHAVVPLIGVTRLLSVNLITGEEREAR